MNANVSAFLATIRHSEGTDEAPDPYAVTFGYQFTITDFSDHPTCLGTWMGEHYRGHLSTAAGAYQLIRPTWLALQRLLSLPDFSPASQDAAALELIREKGALDLVNAGAFEAAVQLCHGVWASLPGSPSGQPQAQMTDLMAVFTGAGGTLIEPGLA